MKILWKHWLQKITLWYGIQIDTLKELFTCVDFFPFGIKRSVFIIISWLSYVLQQVIIGMDTTEMIDEMELSGSSKIDFGIEEIEDEDSDVEDDDEDEEEEDDDDDYVQ